MVTSGFLESRWHLLQKDQLLPHDRQCLRAGQETTPQVCAMRAPSIWGHLQIHLSACLLLSPIFQNGFQEAPCV